MPLQNKILKEQQGGFTSTEFFPSLLLYSKTNLSVTITFYGKPVLFSLRNPTPNQPGEQLPQVPVVVLKFCFLLGLSNLALITKLPGPHTHKRQHLPLQELRTNSLNPASSGQAQSPHPRLPISVPGSPFQLPNSLVQCIWAPGLGQDQGDLKPSLTLKQFQLFFSGSRAGGSWEGSEPAPQKEPIQEDRNKALQEDVLFKKEKLVACHFILENFIIFATQTIEKKGQTFTGINVSHFVVTIIANIWELPNTRHHAEHFTGIIWFTPQPSHKAVPSSSPQAPWAPWLLSQVQRQRHVPVRGKATTESPRLIKVNAHHHSKPYSKTSSCLAIASDTTGSLSCCRDLRLHWESGKTTIKSVISVSFPTAY